MNGSDAQVRTNSTPPTDHSRRNVKRWLWTLGTAAAVVAKANAGIPRVHGDHVHYSGSPELMADYARLALDAGARIIGGCCGTSPAHLAAMRQSIDSTPAGERPTLEEIVAGTGPLTNATPTAGGGGRERVRRRG